MTLLTPKMDCSFIESFPVDELPKNRFIGKCQRLIFIKRLQAGSLYEAGLRALKHLLLFKKSKLVLSTASAMREKKRNFNL
ncbi:hypothetical protein DB43_AB00020 [Parachlamydia acanthamoebae]|uniref:Uncharacterized protein n=1 Tax=Parachlamydia acanthamoebae TaxID=83552 RepID=A0A0C1E5C2_9BACT|nr:hypothetical protein DB43_AB00020 [Parachlamydia acanthamoebae]